MGPEFRSLGSRLSNNSGEDNVAEGLKNNAMGVLTENNGDMKFGPIRYQFDYLILQSDNIDL